MSDPGADHDQNRNDDSYNEGLEGMFYDVDFKD